MEPKKLQPGDAFGYRDGQGAQRVGERSAEWLNGVQDAVRRNSPALPGLSQYGLVSGTQRRPIMGRLIGSASPYSWVEVYPDPDSFGWIDHLANRGGTSNAYEVNNVAGLDGKIAELRPGAPGDYRFQYARWGGSPDYPSPCCDGFTLASAIFADFTVNSIGPTPNCTAAVGGPIAYTMTLNYNPAFNFPLEGVTGRAWVGCVLQVEAPTDSIPGSPFPACTDAPLYLAVTDDPVAIAYWKALGRVPSDTCVMVVQYAHYSRPVTFTNADSWRMPGETCATPVGSTGGYIRGVPFGYRPSGIVCSPTFSIDGSLYDIYEA